jgi:hypothetical protein
MEERTEPDQSTVEAERVESTRAHVADRNPDPAEEAAADEELEALGDDARKDAAAHEQEMNRIGAAVKGEGAIK